MHPANSPEGKKHVKSTLRFAKAYLKHDDDFFKHTLWTDESKIKLYGHNDAFSFVDKGWYSQKNTILTVKHRGSSIMVGVLLAPGS